MVALAQTTSMAHRNIWTEFAVDVPVGAAIFLLIDLAIHEENVLRSRELLVTLTRTDGTPRVDTVSSDAGEFLTIKWIRVNRD